MNLLVTFDKNYIPPFQTMLKSLVLNNPGETFHIWLMHSAIPQMDLQELNIFCDSQGVCLTPLIVVREMFQNAPTSRQYPQEMYYRLLAPLLLPDQDVFNYLYGAQTLAVNDAIWNYDVRYYTDYIIRSSGEYHLDWVMENTAVLHFCGKSKPWKRAQSGRFVALYKHYMQLAAR